MHKVSKEQDRRKKDRFRFGGNRLVVLERDGYKCTSCGMSNDEHNNLWGKSLTVNHINGVGRFSKVPDNRLSNLETLCLRCHGRKDGLRSTRNQFGDFTK